MLGFSHSLPRWLIDITSDASNERVFFVHTQWPELVGELKLHVEIDASDGPIILKSDTGFSLCRIRWKDGPSADEFFDTARSFAIAAEDYVKACCTLV